MRRAPLLIAALCAASAANADTVYPSETIPPGIQRFIDANHSTYDSAVVYETALDSIGRSTRDAVVVVLVPFPGGNALQQAVYLFADQGQGYRPFGLVTGIVGFIDGPIETDPAYVKFTTRVLNAGDPRCCPTGSAQFELRLPTP